MLIDAHAHLNFQAYNKDREEVINRCQNMKVINIGSQFPTSRLALELARKYDNMYATVGLHPIHVGGQEEDKNEMREKVNMSDEEQFVKIRELLKSDSDDRIVAVGETGLDYFHLKTNKHSETEIKNAQEKIFKAHIKLAKEFNKPLMLHCRGSKDNPTQAYQDVLKILNHPSSIFNSRDASGIIHCFSANTEIAQNFIKAGFYIGFTGIITFPNAFQLIEVVKQTPLNRILTETDCPYLAPQPVRGERNEPRYVEYIAKKIAEIKEISYDEVITAVESNTCELFGI